MHDIKIMGRYEAKTYTYKENDKQNYIIVSINESNGKPNHFCRENKYLKDVLYLFFDDIDHEIEGYQTMTNNDAEKVKKFIDIWKDKISNIIVHCHAGISRSSGVACAIARYLNGDDLYIWDKGKYSPNKLCYYKTCKALGIDVTDEEFEYRKNVNEYAFDTWDRENGYLVSKMIINNLEEK